MKRAFLALVLFVPALSLLADSATDRASLHAARDRAVVSPSKGLKPQAEYVDDCGIPSGCGGWPTDPNPTGGTGSRGSGYSIGSHVSLCTALSSLGERCTGCTMNFYGKRECSYVYYAAQCGCDQVHRAGAAPGITDCEPYPSVCRYY